MRCPGGLGPQLPVRIGPGKTDHTSPALKIDLKYVANISEPQRA
jgi:hypothetical protein